MAKLAMEETGSKPEPQLYHGGWYDIVVGKEPIESPQDFSLTAGKESRRALSRVPQRHFWARNGAVGSRGRPK